MSWVVFEVTKECFLRPWISYDSIADGGIAAVPAKYREMKVHVEF
jgi:hypothetical protein